jgi:hypothetical protein
MFWPGFDSDRVRKNFLSAERFMECCDQVWSTDRRSSRITDRRRPESGSIVYAKRDHAAHLFQQLKRRRNRVVLVTSESDDGVEPSEVIPAQIAAWFSTNTTHQGVQPLPLGLGNSYCRVTAKADLLADLSGREKKSLLYVNFRPETNPLIRRSLWESFGSSDWEGCCTRHAGNVSQEEYVSSMSSHRFVLCPRGNGIDTHRMWEALYLGTIPVVKYHPALASFHDLPILFVDVLEGLAPGFLEAKYQEMFQNKWNWEKLFMPWWREQFLKAGQKIHSQVPWSEYFKCRLPGRSDNNAKSEQSENWAARKAPQRRGFDASQIQT